MDILQTLIGALAPHLAELLTGGIFALAAWAVALLRAKVGVDLTARLKEIEARDRGALKEAIETGVRVALARGVTGPDMLDRVGSYVRQSVPDALDRLKPGDGVLSTLIDAQIARIR